VRPRVVGAPELRTMATTRPVTVLDGTQCANGGTAFVLAIGTASPVNCVRQDEFADWYFRVTKSEHLAQLKNKMKRICTTAFIF
jgi:bisdemethoxycurcumin synthase